MASFIGLVIGVTSFLIVLLFANEINQYNNWDAAFNNVFELRYNKPFKVVSENGVMKHQSPLLVKYLKDYPAIVTVCRTREQTGVFFQSSRKADFENSILCADSSFFRMFPFRFKYGNPSTALDSVKNVVISKRMALKYFSRENCIGDSLHFENITLIVSGILDLNGPTTFPVDFVGRLTIPKWAAENGWGNYGYHYYCQLPSKIAMSEREQNELALRLSRKWYSIPQVFESQKDFIGLGKDYQAWNRNPDKIKMQFFSVKKMYLEDKHTLFVVLIVIGFTILLLCCFDYTNKQIGFADMRNIEIGIKSLNGWSPMRIALQVLMETSLFVLVAFFCAFILVELLLPSVNHLLGEHIILYRSLLDFSFLWKLVAFFVLVVLASGIYPAFYMASLEPVAVLKGSYQGDDRGHRFRLVLLSFQIMLGMTISIVVGTVWSQIHFLRNKDMGFDYRHLYYVSVGNVIAQNNNNRKLLDSIVQRYSNIVAHAYTSQMPLVDGSNDFEPIKTRLGIVNCMMMNNSSGFFGMIGFGILVQGTASISKNEILVNQKMVEALRLQEPVVGQQIRTEIPPGFGFGQPETYIIKGVVKNIVYQTWEFNDYPIFYTSLDRTNDIYLALRMTGKDDIAVVQKLEQDLLTIFPKNPMQIKSSEMDYEGDFKQIDFLSKVSSFFSVLIIVGVLLGFTTYTNFYFQKGKKEMVLRMLMGATNRDMVFLFVKSIGVYFIVALLVSWCVGYYALGMFFKHFAFTVSYPYWLYIVVPICFIVSAGLIIWDVLKQVQKMEIGDVLKYK